MKKFLSLFLALVIILTAFPVVTIGHEYDIDSFAYELSMQKSNDLIWEVLTSAIDDSPFVAYFDPITGRVESFSMDGILLGFRYVENEEAFWELVEINRKVTDQLAHGQLFNSDFINRNASMLNLATRTLIEYDAYGNRTETYLGDDYLSAFFRSRDFEENELGLTFDFGADGPNDSPYFDTGWVNMFVPTAPSPFGGSLVGWGFHMTSFHHTMVSLQIGRFPARMTSACVLITNGWGDDFSIFPRIPDESITSMLIRMRTEPYGARVSTVSGTNGFSGVPMRFWAHGLLQTHHIIFDAMGGHVNEWTRAVVDGDQIGALPVPSRAGYDFDGWFTSRTGGSRVTATTRIHSSQTLFARWWRVQSTLEVSHNFWDAPSNVATSHSMNITSNTGWSISSNQSWLVPSIHSSWGSMHFTLRTTSANTNAAARYATVTLRTNDGTVSRFITVRQAGTTTLTVSHGAWSAASGIATSPNMTVTSNTGWTISSNQTWLVPSITSGSGTASFTLRTTSANPNTVARPAVVTIRTTNGLASQTIHVTQAAAQPVVTRNITYHLGTATAGNPPANQPNITVGNNVTLRMNTGDLARPGTAYTFAGWTTSSSGIGGVQYTAGQTISMPNHDLDLFPRWSAAPTVTVTFDPNMGTLINPADATRQVPRGNEVGTFPNVTRAGHSHYGWWTTSTNGVIGGALVDETRAVYGDITFFAGWRSRVTFNASGGIVDETTRYVLSGTIVRPLPTPTKDGHYFVGWYRDGRQAEPTDIVNGHKTLVARWQKWGTYAPRYVSLAMYIHASATEEFAHTSGGAHGQVGIIASNAVRAFRERVNVNFTVSTRTVSSNQRIFLDYCTLPFLTPCCPEECGVAADGVTGNHKHMTRNLRDFWDNGVFGRYSDIGALVVSSQMEALGRAWRPGRTSINDFRYDQMTRNARVLQHELSHNFNVRDSDATGPYPEHNSPCTHGHLCIMRADFFHDPDFNDANIWCPAHAYELRLGRTTDFRSLPR